MTKDRREISGLVPCLLLGLTRPVINNFIVIAGRPVPAATRPSPPITVSFVRIASTTARSVSRDLSVIMNGGERRQRSNLFIAVEP